MRKLNPTCLRTHRQRFSRVLIAAVPATRTPNSGRRTCKQVTIFIKWNILSRVNEENNYKCQQENRAKVVRHRKTYNS